MGTLYDPTTARDIDAKRRGRERVLRDARQGDSPDARWSARDLEWMFAGREDELVEARRVAKAAAERQRARDVAAQERDIIRGLAEQIEEEWRQAAKRAAYEEAIRRHRAACDVESSDAEDELAQRLLARDAG